MPNYNAETLAAMRESNELAHDPNVGTVKADHPFMPRLLLIGESRVYG